jgi:uncharacterized membrane protein (UPF0127 family)
MAVLCRAELLQRTDAMIVVDMRHRPLSFVIALVLLAACGDGGQDGPGEGPSGPGPTPTALPTAPFATDATVVIEPTDGDPVTLRVAIADTPEERTRGLMGIEEMPDHVGMVFLHEEPTESDFWMKDTLIPLSVAVWDESMTIRQIVDMEPCEEDPCPIYDITVAWVGALEVNQGVLDRSGVAVGDALRLDL